MSAFIEDKQVVPFYTPLQFIAALILAHELLGSMKIFPTLGLFVVEQKR
jgi:hypothetical protein